ncbi:MAG: hypothetical protein IT572_07720 [Deltaproteobacteria bacterium]|nr:hypothetical protein [Deltaproteobacteria bacterium]
MTPPIFSKPAAAQNPAEPHPFLTGFPGADEGKPGVISGDGSSFIRLDDKGETFPTVEDLLKAVADEPLFGAVANAKYQPERNKKYLKVTVAILEIRKYLRGDEKGAATAAKKIEEWLSDGELLGDTLVAHQARVNLIKALKKAPKDKGLDEGVKAMLAALTKNYAPKAAEPKPAESAGEGKAKDAAAVLAEMTDAKLFGEKYSAYDAKRNKEYLDVTLALMEVRKVVRGDVSDATAAKEKIAAWLNQYVLLTDAVPHQARVNLVKALEGASGASEEWNKGVAAIVATLRAKYSPAPPEKPAEPEPPKESPKPEEKPAPEKPKEEPPKDAPADKPKEAEKPKEAAKAKALQASYTFTKFTFGAKEKREDTDMTLVKTVMALLRPAIDPLQTKDPEFELKCEMQIKINNETGEVVEVLIQDIKVKGKTSVEAIESALQNIAERFHTRYRFKRGKDDKGPTTVIGIPLDFKKK